MNHPKIFHLKSSPRVIALSILIAFITTNVVNLPAFAFPEKGTGSEILPVPFSASNLQVPSGVGKIEEVFQVSRPLPPAPFVVLIQDAHAIPDAQRNIQKLIEHFQKEYGVGLVALEGASGQLDPRIFRSFPDKEILQETFNDFFEKGELTGSTAAAIFSAEGGSASGGGKEMVFHGIENRELYEEGVELYLKALEEEPGLLENLQIAGRKLQAEKEKIYSKELLEVDKALEAFRRNEEDLVEVLTSLSKGRSVKAPLSIQTILEEMGREGKNSAVIEREVRQIAEKVKKDKAQAPASFNQRYQAFQTSQISAAEFAIYLRELSEKRTGSDLLPVPFSGALARLIKNHKHLRDIQGTQFFRDFETYAQSVKESLFRSDRERTLNSQTRQLELFEKLAKLELSREEWEEIREASLVKREAGFGLHLAFYANAESRDRVFFTNLVKLMAESASRDTLHASLLVAGGFHTEGLAHQFKENGISYVVVRPEIKAIPEHSRYREHMRGEVSWKDYFQVEDGKINLYKAFVRGTRDRLLKGQETGGKGQELSYPVSPVSRPLLKAWRDQILRDLAQKEELARAGEYTQFLDEISQNLQPKLQDKLRREWLANINHFTESLKKLESHNQLTEQSILKLLEPSTTADPVTYRVLSPHEWSAGISNLNLRSEVRSQTGPDFEAFKRDVLKIALDKKPVYLGHLVKKHSIDMRDPGQERQTISFLLAQGYKPGPNAELGGPIYILKKPSAEEEGRTAALAMRKEFIRGAVKELQAAASLVPNLPRVFAQLAWPEDNEGGESPFSISQKLAINLRNFADLLKTKTDLAGLVHLREEIKQWHLDFRSGVNKKYSRLLDDDEVRMLDQMDRHVRESAAFLLSAIAGRMLESNHERIAYELLHPPKNRVGIITPSQLQDFYTGGIDPDFRSRVLELLHWYRADSQIINELAPFLTRSEVRSALYQQPKQSWKEMAEDIRKQLQKLEHDELFSSQRQVHEKIIHAFESVPRDYFVAPDLKDQAFENAILPLADGPHTLSQYKVVVDMLALAGPNLLEGPILEIGSGSGYVTALLSRINEEAQVYGVEMNTDLAASSARILRDDLKIENIQIAQGNGIQGLKEHGPYALILVSAGATHIPQALVDQLKPEGVLVIPFFGQLVRYVKTGEGKLKRELTLAGPYRFVPFQGAVDEEVLEKALEAGTLWLIWKQTRNAQSPDYFAGKADSFGLNLPESFWIEFKKLSEQQQRVRFGEELQKAFLPDQTLIRSEVRINEFTDLALQGKLQFKPGKDPQDFAWQLKLILEEADRLARDPIEKFDEDAFDMVYQDTAELITEVFENPKLIIEMFYQYQLKLAAWFPHEASPAWHLAQASHDLESALHLRSEVRAEPVRILLADKPASESTVEAIRKMTTSFSEEAELIDLIGVGKDKDQLKNILKEKNPAVVIVRSDTKAFQDPEFVAFAKANGVHAVIRMGAGVDNINTEAAKKAEISVIRTHGNANSVANLALRFLLAGLSVPLIEPALTDLSQDTKWGQIFDVSLDEFNKAEESSQKAGRGIALPQQKARMLRPVSPEQAIQLFSGLKGKTIGLVGFGPIAQALAEKLSRVRSLTGIPFKIMATSPALNKGDPDRVRAADRLGVLYPGEDKVLKNSDILSFHLAGEAKNYFTLEKLVKAGKTKLIINTARQDIIASEALKVFLTRPALYFADIDLAQKGQPIQGIADLLGDYPNQFYALPHIAASTANAAAGVEANTLPVLETTLNQLLGRQSPSNIDLDIVNRVPLARSEVRNRPEQYINVGHRGRGGNVVENTLPAFQRAVELGAEEIELDIRLSKDGEIVVFHDSNLSRMTLGKTKDEIKDLTFDELHAIPIEEPGMTPQQIPSLAEILDWAKANHVFVQIEIKHGEGIAKKLVDLLHAKDFKDILVISFVPQFLDVVKKLDPGIPVALVTMPQDQTIYPYKTLDEEEKEYPQETLDQYNLWAKRKGYAGLDLHISDIDETNIRKLREAGLSILVYGIKNEEDMKRAIQSGVDRIASDAPDTFKRVRQEILPDVRSELRSEKNYIWIRDRDELIPVATAYLDFFQRLHRDYNVPLEDQTGDRDVWVRVPEEEQALYLTMLQRSNGLLGPSGWEGEERLLLHINYRGWGPAFETDFPVVLEWDSGIRNISAVDIGLNREETEYLKLEILRKSPHRDIAPFDTRGFVFEYETVGPFFLTPSKLQELPLRELLLRASIASGPIVSARTELPSARSELRTAQSLNPIGSRAELRTQVAALADDPTGRNEIEMGLRLQGFRVEGVSSVEDLRHLRQDHVAVVNLGTRHLEPNEVAGHLKKNWNQASFYKQPMLDLKIDSKMRGPIGALIREVAKRHKSDLILFTPVNPRQGQQVLNGELWITEGGQKRLLHESAYQNEVLMPPSATSSVTEILRFQEAVSGRLLVHVPLNRIREGEKKLKPYLLSLNPGSLVVLDSQTESDLAAIVKAASSLDRRILRVGSAGLLNAAAKEKIPENPVPAEERNAFLPLRPSRGVPLALVTTLNEATRRQTREAQKLLGDQVRLVEIDPLRITGKPAERQKERERIQSMIRPLIRSKTGIILATKEKFLGKNLSKSKQRQLQLALARESAKILRDKKILSAIKYLFVSGGDGVEALEEVFRTNADLRGRFAQDVPWGTLLRGPLKGIPIVTKSGGFGVNDPELLARFFAEGLKPALAISQGDPLGVGPEIAVRLFMEHPEILQTSNPFVIGNAHTLQEALKFIHENLPGLDPDKLWQVRAYKDFHEIAPLKDAEDNTLPVIPVLDIPNEDLKKILFSKQRAPFSSEIQNAAAKLVEDILDRASLLARQGSIDALIRNPINKSRIDLARKARKDKNIFIGHTEYLAENIGTAPALLEAEDHGTRKELETTRMILTHASKQMDLRMSVIHASTVHQSLKDAVAEFTSPDEKIRGRAMVQTAEAILRAGRFAKKNQGILKPRIAVNDLTPQTDTRSKEVQRARNVLRRAIGLARKKDPGLVIAGPLAARDSYTRALFGQVDFVVALYHDQGHIPLKLASSLLDTGKILFKETQKQIYGMSRQRKPAPALNHFDIGPLKVYLSSAAPLPEMIEKYQVPRSPARGKAVQSPHEETLFKTIEFAYENLRSKGVWKPRILVAAINPHAGEEGKFGTEDQTSSLPAIQRAQQKLFGLTIEGPVPADAVFIRAFMEKWDAVITVHRDQAETAAAVYEALQAQGLLLFRPTIAGVNVTEGLKNGFISTSVDHGTNERDAWNSERKHSVIASSLYDAFSQGLDYAVKADQARRQGIAARSENRNAEAMELMTFLAKLDMLKSSQQIQALLLRLIRGNYSRYHLPAERDARIQADAFLLKISPNEQEDFLDLFAPAQNNRGPENFPLLLQEFAEHFSVIPQDRLDIILANWQIKIFEPRGDPELGLYPNDPSVRHMLSVLMSRLLRQMATRVNIRYEEQEGLPYLNLVYSKYVNSEKQEEDTLRLPKFLDGRTRVSYDSFVLMLKKLARIPAVPANGAGVFHGSFSISFSEHPVFMSVLIHQKSKGASLVELQAHFTEGIPKKFMRSELRDAAKLLAPVSIRPPAPPSELRKTAILIHEELKREDIEVLRLKWIRTVYEELPGLLRQAQDESEKIRYKNLQNLLRVLDRAYQDLDRDFPGQKVPLAIDFDSRLLDLFKESLETQASLISQIIIPERRVKLPMWLVRLFKAPRLEPDLNKAVQNEEAFGYIHFGQNIPLGTLDSRIGVIHHKGNLEHLDLWTFKALAVLDVLFAVSYGLRGEASAVYLKKQYPELFELFAPATFNFGPSGQVDILILQFEQDMLTQKMAGRSA